MRISLQRTAKAANALWLEQSVSQRLEMLTVAEAYSPEQTICFTGGHDLSTERIEIDISSFIIYNKLMIIVRMIEYSADTGYSQRSFGTPARHTRCCPFLPTKQAWGKKAQESVRAKRAISKKIPPAGT